MVVEKMVDVGGYEICARVLGSGPTVVLDGGGAGQGLGTWGSVPERVADFATVVTYDRAGVGRSGGTQARSVAEQADVLRRMVRGLELRLPAVFVGWSYGGLVTQVYAARHPDDVAGLIFVDPTAAGTPPGSALVRRLSFDVTAWLLRARAALGGRNARAARELAVTLGGMQDAMAEAKSTREEYGLPPAPIRVIAAGTRPRMPRAQLEHLTADHEDLAGRSPQGRVLVAEHASHQVPYEQPETIVETVREILGRV
ncbi:putative hydrolase or acyltransferase of alpha/beta superfamily [Prauserella sp. Am3]|nr:putative hydrolase or acyltransferase of alpha/beta superfamily [Prauserella sp. Am3]